MPRLPVRNCFPVWLAYRVDPTLHLLRLHNASSFQGGVMAISTCPEPSAGDPVQLCRSILGECARHSFRGVLLDLDHPSVHYERLAHLLVRELPRRSVTLFLPECLAPCAPGCRVLISSALSGGSLDQRLLEAVERHGADRVVLAVEPAAEDFTLPAPTGCGKPLTKQELADLRGSLRPNIHFSRPLCTRYFTYCRNDTVHVVLFDDDTTIAQKLTCARRCGVSRFLLPWCEISGHPCDFLPQ